ncbi:MAG: hypothetical protein WA239_13005 [Candidatus Sulfotelmatobacter sp.]
MTSTTSEPALIADQLRRAFEGDAWHGPALLELLQDVDSTTAAAKPLRNAHSIWELVLHIAVWDGAASRRLAGEKCQPTGVANFPIVPKPTEAAWRKAVTHTRRTHDALMKTVALCPSPASVNAFLARNTISTSCCTEWLNTSSTTLGRLLF